MESEIAKLIKPQNKMVIAKQEVGIREMVFKYTNLVDKYWRSSAQYRDHRHQYCVMSIKLAQKLDKNKANKSGIQINCAECICC